ncbi:oxidoreductase [Sphingomonas sp. DT-204]|uniref:oxidoreductase n=1 Tax=Sphingomonas sp. DT-204 TaxID=3396166 RepID=UPI003F1E1147
MTTSTQTTAVRAGLIGYGYAGRTFHAPMMLATRGLTLAAVVSGDPAKVARDLPDVEVVADPQALIARNDIELVVIASPNASHAPLAAAALGAGKHVVVDKPFTLDLAEAREVVALAEAQGRLLSVFHNRRWDSDFLGVRQSIERGLLGRVTHFESHFDRFRPQVRERWREAPGPGSGIWFDLGPHLIDQALQLFGPPQRVQADLAMQRSGALTDDWAHVVLDYGTLRVILHAGMMVAGGSSRFVVHGEKGSLVKRKPDQQEAQLLAGMAPGSAGWGADEDEMLFYDGSSRERRIAAPAGNQLRFYAGIVDAVRGAAPNPVSPIEALAVMATIEAGLESSRQGRTVQLALTEKERAELTSGHEI